MDEGSSVLAQNPIKEEQEVSINESHASHEVGKGYICYHCQRSRSSLNHLKAHIKKRHLKQKGTELYTMGVILNTYAPRKRRKPRRVKKSKKTIKLHSCMECDYSTPYAGNLKTHLISHSKEMPLSCHICGQATLHSASLRRHIMFKHTHEKPYSCPYCPYRAVQEDRIRQHVMAKHIGEKPNACPYCSFRTVQKGNLRRHILYKHTDFKPFPCPFCQFVCNDDRRLKEHISSIHMKEKPYPCTQCDYRASRKGTLRRHVISKHKSSNETEKLKSVASENSHFGMIC